MKKLPKLTGYTKDELIWIINYLTKVHGDITLRQAIVKLKEKKENDQTEKAEAYLDLACKKKLEYLNLLAPYDGKPLIEIPCDIIFKADQLQKEALVAAQKYDALMQIKE